MRFSCAGDGLRRCGGRRSGCAECQAQVVPRLSDQRSRDTCAKDLGLEDTVLPRSCCSAEVSIVASAKSLSFSAESTVRGVSSHVVTFCMIVGGSMIFKLFNGF